MPRIGRTPSFEQVDKEAFDRYLGDQLMSFAFLAAIGALEFGGGVHVAVQRGAPPLAHILEGHGPGQGFTGVFDATTGRVALRPSTAEALIPNGWVARGGGHGAVSRELGGDAVSHAGFAAIIRDDGGLQLTWRSGTLNASPTFLVPEAARPAIVHAVEHATGRTVTSW